VWTKIRLVNISSDSVFTLCFANSSFSSTNSFYSLASCVLMSSLHSRHAWKYDSMSMLSRCVLLCSKPCTQLIPNVFSTGAINRRSATHLLIEHAVMLLVPFSAEAVHVQAGHFRDPSVMPSRQWTRKSIKIYHCSLGQSLGTLSFSTCTFMSLGVAMLLYILSLHVTGTITVTLLLFHSHCFRTKSHVPGHITCCGCGGNSFCNVI